MAEVTAESIVRLLAAGAAPLDSEHDTCVLCGVSPQTLYNKLADPPDQIIDHMDEWVRAQVDLHRPDCPWRLAREWVVGR